MIKYASNTFLATKVSFINEVANLCELVGVGVTEVAYGIGLDQRIGARFLKAGISWGGLCLPKDVSALRVTANEYDYETEVLSAVVDVNQCTTTYLLAVGVQFSAAHSRELQNRG